MSYEQPPPTPNDLMRKLIAETQANGKTMRLIERQVKSLQIMIGIWFLLSLPVALVMAVFWMALFSALSNASP